MLDRYFWGNPYPFLVVFTAVVLLPVPFLVGAMVAPLPAGCFEYCDMGGLFGAELLTLLLELWLVVWLAVTWVWHDRKPMMETVSAIGASVALAVLAPLFYRVVLIEPITEEVRQIAWVLALGLQLPPVWRLARREPSTRLRFVVGVMGIDVTVAALASLVFGSSVAWSAGPPIVFLAWVVFVVGLLIVAVRAWRDSTASPSVAAPLILATLPIMVLPVAILFPGDLGYVALLEIPLLAIAWLWIPVRWLRGREPAPPLGYPPSSVDGQTGTKRSPDVGPFG